MHMHRPCASQGPPRTAHMVLKALSTFGGAFADIVEAMRKPGPGAYSPKDARLKAGITFKSRYPQRTPEEGPGLLDPRPSTLRSSPAFTMRTLPRPHITAPTPAPGHYDHE